MNNNLTNQMKSLYSVYNNVVKPLIAEIEVRYEVFPTAIFNEIRAFNDHIARCYLKPDNIQWVDAQINKAKGHIERIVLDCYKFLNVSLYDKIIKKFDKSYKGVDLSCINNGEFIMKHKTLTKDIIKILKKAKSKESEEDKSEAISLYQCAHNKYTELEDLIDDNCRNLFWAKGKFYTNKIWKGFLWLLSAIISGIISSCIVPYNRFIELLHSLF